MDVGENDGFEWFSYKVGIFKGNKNNKVIQILFYHFYNCDIYVNVVVGVLNFTKTYFFMESRGKYYWSLKSNDKIVFYTY